jgi:hypothetical protein
MNKNQRDRSSDPAATDDASPTKLRRRIDPIDQPARPLGTKRAALQQLRQKAQASRARSSGKRAGGDIFTLTSHDGLISFTLHKTPQGLLVHREQRQTLGPRLVQTLVFSDLFSFDRWCSVEPLRFKDVVLYQQLLREGHAALSGPV